MNIIKTVELDLCVSCEICSSACPENAISMRLLRGQFLPEVNENQCNMCGICLEVCPGIDIYTLDLMEEDNFMDIIKQNSIECFSGFCKDNQIRKLSTSGGLITKLIIELIKNREFDAAFVLKFHKPNDSPVRLTISNDIGEIIKSAGSKYIPASVYNVIETLKVKDEKKYIIVGTSCQILGIKKFMRKNKISDKNLLFLGLFCDATLNLNFLKFIKELYAKSTEKTEEFFFRTKEKYGWPGHSKIVFNSGRSLILDRMIRISLKKYFNLNRCLFCFDKLNRLSDISFGDCYIQKTQNKEGSSNIIIRTSKGKEIIDSFASIFDLKEEKLIKILLSQNIMKKYKNFLYARLLAKNKSLFPIKVKSYKVSYLDRIKLKVFQYYLGLGQNYKCTRILIDFLFRKLMNKLNLFLKYVIK